MANKLLYQSFSYFDFEVWDNKPEFSFKEVHQIHSPLLLEFKIASRHLKADGIFFQKEELEKSAIAIKTADCMPIVAWNETEGVFLHAGWRGLKEGILKKFNFTPTNAYIGPSISKESFEVTSEFQEYFPKTKLINHEGRFYFDLQTEATRQLREINKNIFVQDSRVCTLKNLEYNSFRRNKTHIRNYNIIRFKRNCS